MPTIATFGAGSARGFGAGELKRFIYEFIGATSVASVGTTWNGTENFAYFSFGGGNSTTAEVFSSMTFSGTTGFINSGIANGSSGSRIIGLGAINLDLPVAQTVLLNTATGITGSKFYTTFRILGGTAEPTVFYSDVRGGATWPYTYSIPNCKAGDIVLLGLVYKSSGTPSSTATNMTIISTPTTDLSVQTFATYVTSDSTFTTTLNGTESTEWTQGIVVLRANNTGVSPVTGSQTFTANGTFTIPSYLSLTVDADSGQGGKGGSSGRETGGGSCGPGTAGSAGGATTVIGSGISVTAAGGSGGSAGACSPGFCSPGNVGNINNTTTNYSSGLTVGGTATVTIGNGGAGGANSVTPPCSTSPSNAANGAKGSVTITWTS